MSPTPYTSIYGPLVGRGQVEAHVLSTIATWIVPYVAEYERQNGIPPRQTPTPPTPESIHGGVDDLTWSSELLPEIVVITEPTGETERHEAGQYGSWFQLQVSAFCYVEGDQDATRQLSGVYGAALMGILTQQGGLGHQPDGTTSFATRTRLSTADATEFLDQNVRDIMRTSIVAHTFVAHLVSDYDGPRVPPLDPYADPGPWTTANEVEVDLSRRPPDVHGLVPADAVIDDGTVNPPVVRYKQKDIVEP